jgi:hypothetical protein
MPTRLEQVPAALGEDHCSVVRAERRRVQQALSFEVALGSASVLSAVMDVALGHDAKGADSREHPASGAVDLVHAIAVPHWRALTAAWKGDVLREHIVRVALVQMIAVADARTAAAASVAEVVAVAVN